MQIIKLFLFFFIKSLNLENSKQTNNISESDIINLNIYPNPSKEIVNISINIIEAGNYTIEIYNSIGEKSLCS